MSDKSEQITKKSLLAVTVVAMLFIGMQGCTMSETNPSPEEDSLTPQDESRWETVTFDEWRQYAFDAGSLKQWTDGEGNEIIDTWVRVTYENLPGTALYDIQKWHVDARQNRYRISDNFSYDQEDNLCET
ncbi:hypothetical protein [Anoxynatronum buryatiense]|uniref:Uncharacterized protein n=1 Tax=Anoxynatronum buryatiense TaxID=489973 RepID=A0AA46AJB4_9CLOT|nr:hypothetical protein [Anoxynatronum buryatiense]SMP58749.1 hypothetical protein SAMN06296020_107117 [Anoxynatronum buryatiense]